MSTFIVHLTFRALCCDKVKISNVLYILDRKLTDSHKREMSFYSVEQFLGRGEIILSDKRVYSQIKILKLFHSLVDLEVSTVLKGFVVISKKSEMARSDSEKKGYKL